MKKFLKPSALATVLFLLLQGLGTEKSSAVEPTRFDYRHHNDLDGNAKTLLESIADPLVSVVADNLATTNREINQTKSNQTKSLGAI